MPYGQRELSQDGGSGMVDTLSSEKRSALMASIRTVGTTPELRVRKIAHRCGLRFRIAPRRIRGRPDLSFSGARVAVFVHGCFWHGHDGCCKATLPATNTDFWSEKIAVNRRRDKEVQNQLLAEEWQIVVIWECETRDARIVIERLAPVIVHYRGPETLAMELQRHRNPRQPAHR